MGAERGGGGGDGSLINKKVLTDVWENLNFEVFLCACVYVRTLIGRFDSCDS